MAENHHFQPRTGISTTSEYDDKSPIVISQGQHCIGNPVPKLETIWLNLTGSSVTKIVTKLENDMPANQFQQTQ